MTKDDATLKAELTSEPDVVVYVKRMEGQWVAGVDTPAATAVAGGPAAWVIGALYAALKTVTVTIEAMEKALVEAELKKSLEMKEALDTTPKGQPS